MPTHKPDLQRLSIKQLAALVRCRPETMRRRLDGLAPVETTRRERLYDSSDALGRYFTGESLNLTRERARLAREQADAQEIRNREARSELIPAADNLASLLAIASPIAAGLDALPTRAAPELVGCATVAEVESRLRPVVAELQHALAELGAEQRTRFERFVGKPE